MSIPTHTYEEARAAIFTLPSLSPRPNSINLQVIYSVLVKRLESIPCHGQEAGYAGMIEALEVFALRSNVPWRKHADSAPHRAGTDGTLTAAQ